MINRQRDALSSTSALPLSLFQPSSLSQPHTDGSSSSGPSPPPLRLAQTLNPYHCPNGDKCVRCNLLGYHSNNSPNRH